MKRSVGEIHEQHMAAHSKRSGVTMRSRGTLNRIPPGPGRLAWTAIAGALISLIALQPLSEARVSVGESKRGFRPVVQLSGRHDVSPPLRELTPAALRPKKALTVNPFGSGVMPLPSSPDNATTAPGATKHSDVEVAQSTLGPMPDPIASFDGVSDIRFLPPDPNGDVGPDHYVQMVNSSFGIFTKDGTRVFGPVDNNTLWAGLGGPCEKTNDGDPIVLYDHLADRWLLSQFSIPNPPEGPFYECVAVSQTGDPTGSYFRYEFRISKTRWNDYPKLGVWPDAYYMSANQFEGVGGPRAGVAAVAFERDKMLQGLPARMVYFDLFDPDDPQFFFGQLPSDLDGPPPAAGTPNYFASVSYGGDAVLRIWEYHVDWTDPDASTFGVGGRPNSELAVAPAFFNVCLPVTRGCIPQPAAPPLHDVGDRLMHRLQYRTFGGRQTLVVNHTVTEEQYDAHLPNHAGVRWYELRDMGTGWAIRNQGEHRPDGDSRWMGSAATDNNGNLAIGYSVSGHLTFPSLRYAGRLADDPPNTLPRSEATLVAGKRSQLYPIARWGDYSMLTLDQTDDCTFWFTGEYYGELDLSEPDEFVVLRNLANWSTRIGAFRFPSCIPAVTGSLQGTVVDARTGTPVANALVEAGGYSAVTDDRGFYAFLRLPRGTYDVTASAAGYVSAPRTSFPVLEGESSIRDFSL
jgi:hypothetical protein